MSQTIQRVAHLTSHVSKTSFAKHSANVLILPQLRDNLSYLVTCPDTGCCAIVDCAQGHGVEVANMLEAKGINEYSVLTTHKHTDHAGGNGELKKRAAAKGVFCAAYDRRFRK